MFHVVYLDDIFSTAIRSRTSLNISNAPQNAYRRTHCTTGSQNAKIGTSQTGFLGFFIGKWGVIIGYDRKKIVHEWPRPTSLTELRSFLWSVSINFMPHLTITANGFDAIPTLEDRFSRIVHLAAYRSTDSALDIVYFFFHEVFRKHSLPDSIDSSRYSRFMAKFWKRISERYTSRLKMSSSQLHKPMGPRRTWSSIMGITYAATVVLTNRTWNPLWKVQNSDWIRLSSSLLNPHHSS